MSLILKRSKADYWEGYILVNTSGMNEINEDRGLLTLLFSSLLLIFLFEYSRCNRSNPQLARPNLSAIPGAFGSHCVSLASRWVKAVTEASVVQYESLQRTVLP